MSESEKHLTKLILIKQELDSLRKQNEILKRAVEHYANHESVIKEAYHSNDSGQITCVHTFINHVAKQALADCDKLTEKGE